jgi:allantoicase
MNSSDSALVCLVQAMIGALSPNFRRISFRLTDKEIVILFQLYGDVEEDIDEIQDIIFELEAMLVGDLEVQYSVQTGDLTDLEEGSRIVFSMRSEEK